MRNNGLDMKLEVIVIPVSDVDRAKDFYTKTLGWRLDGDFVVSESFRAVQVTAPGSPCSILFGKGLTMAKPGSAQGFHLVVSDIAAARDELADKGVKISEVFHDADGGLHHAGNENRASGPDPKHRSYFSFAS